MAQRDDFALHSQVRCQVGAGHAAGCWPRGCSAKIGLSPEGNAATLLNMLTRVPAAAVNGRRGLKYTQMDAEKPAAKRESLAQLNFPDFHCR